MEEQVSWNCQKKIAIYSWTVHHLYINITFENNFLKEKVIQIFLTTCRYITTFGQLSVRPEMQLEKNSKLHDHDQVIKPICTLLWWRPRPSVRMMTILPAPSSLYSLPSRWALAQMMMMMMIPPWECASRIKTASAPPLPRPRPFSLSLSLWEMDHF